MNMSKSELRYDNPIPLNGAPARASVRADAVDEARTDANVCLQVKTKQINDEAEAHVAHARARAGVRLPKEDQPTPEPLREDRAVKRSPDEVMRDRLRAAVFEGRLP
jgi:hypothetical protein